MKTSVSAVVAVRSSAGVTSESPVSDTRYPEPWVRPVSVHVPPVPAPKVPLCAQLVPAPPAPPPAEKLLFVPTSSR